MTRIVELRQSVFADNDADADRLRSELSAKGTTLINIMSSPGSGKTTLLLALIPRLREKVRLGVMEADIDSAVDADAIRAAGADAVQLHTGGMCHLDADMTRQGIDALGGEYELIFLENIGNLVCPAEFDTGAHLNITILSVPEGDDKPLKYPLMYEKCDLLIVSKTDVQQYFDFSIEKLTQNAKMRNPNIAILPVSAKTGAGMDELAECIIKTVLK